VADLTILGRAHKHFARGKLAQHTFVSMIVSAMRLASIFCFKRCDARVSERQHSQRDLAARLEILAMSSTH
jgi:hypothetical protein